MKTRIAAAIAAVVLGVAAPASSALAFDYGAPEGRYTSNLPYDVTTTGSITASDGALYDRCPMSSAAEGNANQQNFPVKQYGQTSGGYRC
ncbi:hypothetical protein HNR00_002305 [Methylorubrum rhodinum]|uniref:Uncharacterized protein n=1 Tax=Methylorubrum rhodinum TaxID=29428 RepID=A0A840ZKT7_9HYPH|nr:hypothetical protein [Methylorubrum rhodinum]MBB5757591.1 hypothetical protein [Methylorubrum rhodinum]